MTNVFSKLASYKGLKNEFPKRRKLEHGDVKRGEKVREFRKQEEFGPKKFIKP
jgi:hypothetical protein